MLPQYEMLLFCELYPCYASIKESENPFSQHLLLPLRLQELHRAAVRHARVEGGHRLDSAPFQSDCSLSHTSALLEQRHPPTQEWDPLALTETA